MNWRLRCRVDGATMRCRRAEREYGLRSEPKAAATTLSCRRWARRIRDGAQHPPLGKRSTPYDVKYFSRRSDRRAAVMKILVTGAAGFIGSTCQGLARGDEVVGLDNLNDYYDPRLKAARLEKVRHTRIFALLR